jgi:hypothetical protein
LEEKGSLSLSLSCMMGIYTHRRWLRDSEATCDLLMHRMSIQDLGTVTETNNLQERDINNSLGGEKPTNHCQSLHASHPANQKRVKNDKILTTCNN